MIKCHLSTVSVSGFCWTGEGSDAVTLALTGAPGHLLGINICGWNRRDTQRTRKTPKLNWNSSKKTKTENATAVNEEFSHLEFSPQEKLTLRWGSVQMEPLVQDQLRFREHLSDRNHQRTNGQSPAVGQLEKHSVRWKHRDVYKSKDDRFCHCVAEIYSFDYALKPAHLNKEHIYSGVANQKAECFIPLRRCCPVTHLQKYKSVSIIARYHVTL